MPESYRVVITDFLEDASIEAPLLADLAEVEMRGARHESELFDVLPSADALIVFHDIARLSDAALSRATRCKGIVRAGVGFDNIDVDAARKRGIVVCNVPDYGAEEVADHAIMLLLAVVRRLIPLNDAIKRGGWDLPIINGVPRLRGRTLGLVGCGRIGTATALRAKAFGLEVVFFDPYVAPGMEKALGIQRANHLEELLEQSDYVSIHCYLDAATHHIINAKTLSWMPQGAVLINTARGPLVDQAALVEALDSGHLGGAGLDVVEREPIDDERLRLHPQVVLTPHAAFYSVEGHEELRRKAAEEVRRLLLGEAPRCPVSA